MKHKTLWKRTMCALMSTAMLTAALAGCGSDGGETPKDSTPVSDSGSGSAGGDSDDSSVSEAGNTKYPEFLTVDVFGSQSNFQGIQPGWFAKVVREKFNMELNIIAPNVAGGGDSLYQTRCANKNLGDLIFAGTGDNRLKDLVATDLILDMTPYMDGCENLQRYRAQIENASQLAEQDGLWVVPSQISGKSPFEPCEATEPTNAPSVRWDLYGQIGYPEIKTLEDLLPVLQQMQEAAGESDSGKKVYALSLFKDWDGDMMHNAVALTALYGYYTNGFVLYNSVTEDIQSAIDNDSPYIRGLRFLYQANQLGLVDPESTTQNFDTVSAKYTDGAVIYSLWPWLGTGYYNTVEHVNEGKGFASATLQDGEYLCFGNSPDGDASYAVMVGSKAKDPQRMVDFIDWLYSAEGIMMSTSQTGGAGGPQGLTWENQDGKPVFTNFGRQVLVEKKLDTPVPEEWGTGTWKDGISALNYPAVGITDADPETGIDYNFARWDDYARLTETALTKDWSEHNEGARVPIKYFQEKGLINVFPAVYFVNEDYSMDLSAVKEQCKQILIQYSWQMVFAKDEAEFDSLLKEMQETAIGLGYEEVFEFDKTNTVNRFEAVRQYKAENNL